MVKPLYNKVKPKGREMKKHIAYIGIKLTEAEKKKIINQATSKNISVSEYIRERCLMESNITDIYRNMKAKGLTKENEAEYIDMNWKLKDLQLLWVNLSGLYQELKSKIKTFKISAFKEEKK